MKTKCEVSLVKYLRDLTDAFRINSVTKNLRSELNRSEVVLIVMTLLAVKKVEMYIGKNQNAKKDEKGS